MVKNIFDVSLCIYFILYCAFLVVGNVLLLSINPERVNIVTHSR